jgi:broad specificity phosphatase PhoE
MQVFSMDTNYLVAMRHGHGEHLIDRVFSSLTEDEGGVDHHLTEQGRAEVTKTAQDLFTKGFNQETVKLVLVSPLNRTKETAQILVDCGVCSKEALQIDERIREHQFYKLEGLVKESLAGIEQCPYWTQELSFLEQRGAERLDDFIDRVDSLLTSLKTSAPIQGHIILVTHGAVVSMISSLYGDGSAAKTAEARIFPIN